MAVQGRTRWGRFVGLLLPALAVVVLMMIGVWQGALPVSAAVGGNQRIKISADQITGLSSAHFPRSFRARDGADQTVVLVGLSNVEIRSLCASGKVYTPLGDYVLRIETHEGGPPLRAADLQMAIQEIDGVEVAINELFLNRAATAPDGTPAEARPPGTLPINAKALALDINADVRWVTASNLKISALDLTLGLGVEECF